MEVFPVTKCSKAAGWLLLSAVLLVSCGPGRRVAGAPAVETKAAVSPAIAAGQYSGITHIDGSRYAVVDDKLPGGGIVFFDIDMDPGTGAIRLVRAEVPPATKLSNVSGRDGEGIAYANGKLYVSAESDQSIREYDLDGNPTGQAFAIPAEMGVENIVPNGGFEAFTYSPATGCFWATTERPLLQDTVVPRLHRLQRFDARFRPDRQYLYQMDEPLRTPDGTRAYIHGISALAALDDGSLVVLEREVSVPAGWVKALNETVSVTKLYQVTPSGNGRDILPKHLLLEFTTRASDLANFEGMCQGPVLRDGRRTLLLIADSQGGGGGWTREYLKIVILPANNPEK